MTDIKNSVLNGTFFGLIMGIWFSVIYDIHYAIISGLFSGILFGVGIYLFIKSKAVEEQTGLENNDGASVILSGSANHFINAEAVGGILYLLTNRLEFKSHDLNIQNHHQMIPLAHIKEIGFYNTLGIIPNGLSITKYDDTTEKYVVNNRRLWKEKIEHQMLVFLPLRSPRN